MKILLYYVSFLLAISITSCKKEIKNRQEIRLTNTSEFELTDKPISVKRELLILTDSMAKYPVVTFGTDTIPSQIDDTNMDGAWDALFFVIDFKSKESKDIQLHWADEEPTYETRTSVRFGKRASLESPVRPATQETMLANELPRSIGYQQYQTDGPSWENDKVGFRHYLDGRNAKDLFGKKTSKISPETVGINVNGAVEDNYHVMEEWGRDILAVGNSVGIGGYALAAEKELMRLGVTVDDSINNVEKTLFEIRTEGPVKSVLGFTYENWKPNDRTYSVQEATTIWPGMYGYQNTVAISGLRGDENLAVGLVNINNDKPMEVIDSNSEYIILLTHDKQSYDKEWWLGMALILPKDLYIDYTEAPKTGKLSNSYLAHLEIKKNEPITYYAVAAWELSDEKFVDRAYFKAYVTNLTDQLSAKISIETNN